MYLTGSHIWDLPSFGRGRLSPISLSLPPRWVEYILCVYIYAPPNQINKIYLLNYIKPLPLREKQHPEIWISHCFPHFLHIISSNLNICHVGSETVVIVLC